MSRLKYKSRWSLKTPLYLTKKDKRFKRHKSQLKTNGFSDSETWSLDSVVAEFVLPRLKRFKEVSNGFPMGLTEKQWDAILDKMIFAFEFHLKEEPKENADYERFDEGMQLFGKWFHHLWW